MVEMNLNIDAAKWRKEHGLIYPEEYKQIVDNNYHLMMVLCFFLGMGINELINLIW